MAQSGLLLIPFQNDSRSAGLADHLKELETWLVQSASACGVALNPVRGNFDGNLEILRKITLAIEGAHLVIAVLTESNPNVLFEAGYAYALNKPLLYVGKADEKIPFDANNFEYLSYRNFGEHDTQQLKQAIHRCLARASARVGASLLLTQLRQYLMRDFSPRLYRLCIHYNLTSLVNWAENWGEKGPLECRGAQRILETGTFILENLEFGGFVTFYYPGEYSWEPDNDERTNDEYLNMMRKVVQEGTIMITRVYVLHDEEDRHEQRFWQLIQRDMEAGIKALYILERDLPNPLARDFGLWDDELFCEVHYVTSNTQKPRMSRCTYYCDTQHLTDARRWRDDILAKASQCPLFPSERLLLEESCDEQSGLGARYCAGSRVDLDDCRWYHGNWQYLRLCNVVSCPGWHEEFYVAAFRSWLQEMRHLRKEGDDLRILLSGLADYSMLYQVVTSMDLDELPRCVFHVLDLCQTPLNICRWLQQRLQRKAPKVSLRLEFHKANILGSDLPSSSFDLITSDAFLTRFETHEKKRRVYEEWIRLLRLGGWIVTTARIKTMVNEVLAPAEAKSAFVARTCERAAHLRLAQLQPQAPQEYSERMRSYPFESEDEVRSFLQEFRVDISSNLECLLLDEYELIVPRYARIVSRKTM